MPTPIQKFVSLQRKKHLSSTPSSTTTTRSPQLRRKTKKLLSPQKTSLKSALKKKKPMSTRSAKAKGRKLQTWVVEKILSLFPVLSPLDVKSTPMGVNGVDVQLSTLAQKLFPFDIECKNTERTKTIYNYYEQAIDHTSGGEPLVIIKMNRQKPLAIVDAEYFMELTLCKKKKI